ncbi:MAG: hypothetical protein RR382_00685, partial [Tannerellaceae bacterium]
MNFSNISKLHKYFSGQEEYDNPSEYLVGLKERCDAELLAAGGASCLSCKKGKIIASYVNEAVNTLVHDDPLTIETEGGVLNPGDMLKVIQNAALPPSP